MLFLALWFAPWLALAAAPWLTPKRFGERAAVIVAWAVLGLLALAWGLILYSALSPSEGGYPDAFGRALFAILIWDLLPTVVVAISAIARLRLSARRSEETAQALDTIP